MRGMRMSSRATSGRSSPGEPQRLDPVGGLGDHLDVGLGAEDLPQPAADHRLVVGDEHADRHTGEA